MDPVVVLAALTSMVQDTEATIIRLQAVREAQLAVAHRLAEHLASESESGSGVRGEAVELASRSVAAELAGVLHMSDRVVQARMARAAELVNRYPVTMQAFTEARIGPAHVRQIQDAGARLDDTARVEFEQVAVAASVGETPHRAKRVIERIAERLAPRSLTERHREAQENRRVWREDLPDGQKMLGLIHAAAIVDGIYDRLTQQARTVHVANTQAGKSTRDATSTRTRSAIRPTTVQSISCVRTCAWTPCSPGHRPDTTRRTGCSARSRLGSKSRSPYSR